MDISIIINLILIAILIFLTAFFVGSEFAVVKVRVSRIDQLIAEGNKKALSAKKLVTDLDYYLSACQLGITVTALGLGTLGEPTVERMLHPLFDHFGMPDVWSTFISYALALSIMTFLHVVIGELAPKTLAIQYAERLTLLLGPPMVLFGKLMFPLIWLLNGSARVMLRMFGVQPASHEQAHSEEELKIIMTQSYESGEINQAELSYVQNIFAFDARVARDIMIPRTQVIVLNQQMDTEEILGIIDEYHYTRYPVTEDGDKDHIIGFLNAKELVTNIALNRDIDLAKHIHKIDVIHEAAPLQEVLVRMQRKGVHIALVVDEYGGTAGIITLEDILEEIVGEIRDEFDEDEVPEIIQQSDTEYLISGRVLLKDLEEQMGIEFEDAEDIDTIGGWMQSQAATLEGIPEAVVYGNYSWKVVKRDKYQVIQVSLSILEEAQQAV